MESHPDAAARLDKAQKRAFNEHIRCAKAHESAARPREALEEYSKALLVFGGEHATLLKKVVSLQKRLDVASTPAPAPEKRASFWFSTPVATVEPDTVDIPDSAATTDGVAASTASCHVLSRALASQLAASPFVDKGVDSPPECLPLVPSRTALRASTPPIAVHAQAMSPPMSLIPQCMPRTTGTEALELPGGYRLAGSVASRLYPHQIEGVTWLWSLHGSQTRHGGAAVPGGCLADDMGLGKTVQVTAFIEGLFTSRKARSFLIVAPLSVLAVWEAEFHSEEALWS